MRIEIPETLSFSDDSSTVSTKHHIQFFLYFSHSSRLFYSAVTVQNNQTEEIHVFRKTIHRIVLLHIQ